MPPSLKWQKIAKKGFTNPRNHAASRRRGLRSFRYIAVSDTIRVASPCPRHVPRGHGGGGAVRPWKDSPLIPSRARTGSGRGVPISRAFWLHSIRRAGGKRRAYSRPEPERPDNCQHRSRRPCGISPKGEQALGR